MAFIETFLADKVSHVPERAVIVEEETGINAICAFYYNRVAPWAGRIFGCDHIIIPLGLPPFRDKGIDNIESSLMIADTGSPQAL